MQKLRALAIILSCCTASQAWALDCSKAKSAPDKALCTNPRAAAADAAMAKAYAALAARFSAPEKKALQISQRAWLKDRAGTCSEGKPEAIVQCLSAQSLQRQRYLEGRPETGEGSGGTLTPLLIQVPGRPGYHEIDVAVLKYAPATNAGERLFNQTIDQLIKDMPEGENDDPYGADKVYSYLVHARMIYASPKLISARLETYEFEGGAHGNGGTSDINIDVATGKRLQFDDVFASGASDKLTADCVKQILKEKSVRMPDEDIEGDALKTLQASIAAGLSKLDGWSFSPEGARVDYNAYELGAYVEGGYACHFSPGFLKPLVKASFTLPR